MPTSENIRKRDILVPDFLLKKSTGSRIADLKTLSYTANNYSGRRRFENGAAVNARLGPPGSTKNTAVKPGRLTGNGTTRHKTPSAPSNHASTNSALSSPSSSATSVRPTKLSAHS